MPIFSKLFSNFRKSKNKKRRRPRRQFSQMESLESRVVLNADPVLMVIADQQDFYYTEYGSTRDSIEAAGLEVEVAARTINPSTPHPGTGQNVTEDGLGIVTPDIALSDVDVDDYSAIVFVGGWGSSMYQYDFPGDYSNNHYDGDSATKEVVNDLIGQFMAEDKHVAAICHGVTILAWARVDGVSPLNGREVSVPDIGSPAVLYNGAWYGNAQLGQREQVLANGAIPNLVSGEWGDPTTNTDDVVVDGRIITAENYDTAVHFGAVVATEVLAAANDGGGDQGGGDQGGGDQGGDDQTGNDDLFLIDDQTTTAQQASIGLQIVFPTVSQDTNPAWTLDQEHEFFAPEWLASGGYGENYHGAGERWVQDSNGADGFTWHFITPEGDLHAWDGSIEASPLIASLGSEFHADPSLLTDPEQTVGEDIEYSVSVVTSDPVSQLDQVHGFFAPDWLADGGYGENHHGAGEVWIQDSNGEDGFTWHYITPGGDLHEWNGSFEASPLIASLGSEFHADPSLLTEASANEAAVSVENNVLTIQTNPGYVGQFEVTLVTNNSLMVAEQNFVVNVTNEAPIIGPIADQVMAPEQTMLQIPLDISDADGDNVSVTATVLDEAYQLAQDLNLQGDGDFGLNWGGQNEKWMQGAGGWYFILANGELRHWQGSFESSELIANLDSRYYADPNLLVNAQPIAVTAEVVDGVLIIQRDVELTGSFQVQIEATDGAETTSALVQVTVESL